MNILVLVIGVSVGVLVAALVSFASVVLQKDDDFVAESRLDMLTSASSRKGKGKAAEATLLSQPLGDNGTALENLLENTLGLQRMLDQADVAITPTKLVGASVGAGALAFAGIMFSGAPILFAPIAGFACLLAPLFYMNIKRSQRMTKFNQQLPEALELLSRSLRAGHSLGAGFGLVASEMPNPIRREFGRCFEEQNFGISLEESLNAMTVRIPNMDLRFLATAIILQRQTGGDLAEILDKISRLIRERFKLAGTIQALTGEGRLSGIVLMSLPPGLFVVMYFLNREYIMSLFKDDMGRWLLGGTIVMQLVGAFVIRKIVDIKV
ncbi:MAG: type II secretion system F family protein [Planctomycetota bacterium]|nr:type II secretion system F family protein [Planctomycetota bacterium]